MVDLMHLSLGAIAVVMFLALSLYCFRLINKFFKGGIFEAPLKAFMATGVFITAAMVLSIVTEVVEPGSLDLHAFHMTLEISGGGTFLYGAHRLYKAWTKLGHAEFRC